MPKTDESDTKVNPTHIYRKTELGAAALKDRRLLADSRLRPLLIMIDGQRSLQQLAKMAIGQIDVESQVQSLLVLGMVELLAGQEPKAAAPATPTQASDQNLAVSSPRPGPLSAAQFLQARRQAARQLLDAVGPAGEGICMRIEDASNVDDLLALLPRAQGLIQNMRGTEVANRYAASVQALLV